MIPTNESGRPFKTLVYKGEEFEKLDDNDIKRLSEALVKNDKYFGSIVLKKNNLSDLSALYLADAMKKFEGIRGLDLSKNNLSSRAGEYIGEALTPEYRIHFLSFRGNCLETFGLRRVLEAVNANEHIEMLDIGVISNAGLEMVTGLLKSNTNLNKLRITECPDAPFEKAQKDAFCQVIQNYTELEEIKVKLNTKDKMFQQELKSKLKAKCKDHKQQKKLRKRNKELILGKMVKQLDKIDKNPKARAKMPVRQYFTNTFGNILNDAMYELQRKQNKFPDKDEYFTVEGSIKYIADHILDNLPEWEKNEAGALESNHQQTASRDSLAE